MDDSLCEGGDERGIERRETEIETERERERERDRERPPDELTVVVVCGAHA